ncbi:EscU/YscU/HrcU family type III secretion system export apparatus switch protein [Noviherbaspirillum massiliense]|uniref:EscU/YscU/HrcU family type III secretion system export apparatus switch protein n=1 Tax=Noviherbaspirillum massiliense TaxID=1465823 RepID=UPI00031EBF9C|nr:EscU/YscU/HrcU family type III secretion system export apparatus switch protein [Noviherbaspirillum massiliense]
MNPDKRSRSAVALAYQTGDVAPKVVARGRGLVAEQIIERAREHGIFVHESKELVALLMQVDLDRHIPPALYRAVAELLAWLYHLERIEGQYKGGAAPLRDAAQGAARGTGWPPAQAPQRGDPPEEG